jgi:hypothetical protein
VRSGSGGDGSWNGGGGSSEAVEELGEVGENG